MGAWQQGSLRCCQALATTNQSNPIHTDLKFFFRYQKFSIAEDIDLVVRCELDGVISMKGQDQLLSIKALNEFDSKTTGMYQPWTLQQTQMTRQTLHVAITS